MVYHNKQISFVPSIHILPLSSSRSQQGQASLILNDKDTSGKAAMHWAACQNLGACIKELRRQGASV